MTGTVPVRKLSWTSKILVSSNHKNRDNEGRQLHALADGKSVRRHTVPDLCASERGWNRAREKV